MKKIGGMFRCMFAVLCICTGLWCGILYLKDMREYCRGEEDLARVYAVVKAQEEQKKPKPKKPAGALVSDYAPLLAENGDVAGWIRIEGLPVDYPVLCSPSEPDFYLDHGFDKAPSAYGMIYMEAVCAAKEECKNVLLYGHHMKNGAMFGALDQYLSPEFGRAHPQIRFDTLEIPGVYELAAVFCLPAGELGEELTGLLPAESREDYEALVKYMEKEMSIIIKIC